MISDFHKLKYHRQATAGDYASPTMLTVGDSIMWGQGLRPEHRFRELVRQALEVNELSLARSGAFLINRLDNGKSYDESLTDADLKNQAYADEDYVREVPGESPSVYEQLLLADRILNHSSDDNTTTPNGLNYILMNGGINDFGLGNILLPIQALVQGYAVKTWPSFIMNRFEEQIQPAIEETLRLAVKKFPNATIVYTGYYPIVSGYSVADGTLIYAVAVLYGLMSSLITPSAASSLFPLSAAYLEAMATASYTWQSVSNKLTRQAIDRVTQQEGLADSHILFARSFIEDDHCMFANNPMLWELAANIDQSRFPENLAEMGWSEWSEFLAHTIPQDNVADERAQACQTIHGGLSASIGESLPHIACNLASVGHPNALGAHDYASSVLERLGYDWPGCANVEAQWRRRCADLHDAGVFNCTKVTRQIGRPCDEATTTLWQTTQSLFEHSGEHFQNIGHRAQEIQNCSQAAKTERQQCNAEYHQKKANCLNDRAAKRQGCRQNQCDTQFDCQERCNHHRCTRFDDCKDRFGPLDPRRAWCLGKRKACEAGNTAKRLACKASCTAERELCKAKATAERLACMAKAEAAFVACTAKARAEQVACTAKATAEHAACTIVEGVRMAWDAIRGVALGLAGVAVGAATAATAVACFAITFAVNRLCRLGVLIGEGLCRFGKSVQTAICMISNLGSGSSRAEKRMPDIQSDG
jgi:hypothetical protein